MNQQQAKTILDETFNKEFDVLKFSGFLKELVNNSNLYVQDKSQFIPGQFRDYILKVEKLGQYKDKAGKSMELLAIKLAKHSSLERARTMQRNFIAKWLAKNPDEPEGAIVGFYDEEQDWRFSFVKLEYNLVKDEKGNLKAKKELTPAKRYSFLVGPNEPNHTCKKQFIELLTDDKHDPLFDEIEKAFSIEKVTKEFFEEYKKRFLDLKESLEKVVKKDVVVKNEFIRIVGDDDLQRFIIEFSKKLLGQIVFLYFLQKKGWLGVRKDDLGRFKEWGTGPKDFMKRLFRKEYCSYNNFFNDVLEPLFYNTLAIKRTDDFSDKFECKIPFLNGGLFEPLDGYDWMNTNINLDDDIFRGIFKTFDEFNFTVKEDEPLEKEVAVDPEMLGKVFENLLEVTDRKSKGAFYTPREIVHYMCQQSLINYLETNSDVPREDIEKFIQEGDKFLDQTIKAQEQKKKYHGRTYDIKSEYTIPKSIEKNYELLDRLLKDIKVVDPAVGSGAFPVGMMNEIVKARSILSIYFDGDRDVSELKRDCIENSLYGVDIMPSAVDICQLRFWLSLVVDELDRKKIKPLPNLDNKIMCGNSLLEEFEGVKLFDESLLGEEVKDIKPELDRIDKEINDLNAKIGRIARGKVKGNIKEIEKEIKKLERKKKKLTATESTERNLTLGEVGKAKRNEAKIMLGKLKAKQKQFFNSYDRDTKKELKNEIEKLEWDLIKVTLEEQGNEEALERLDKIMRTKSKPFFLWKLYFAEVFQRENPGFDVVIANPPYVDSEIMVKELPETRKIYTSNFESAKGNWDLFIIFIEQGINLLRQSGVISYIIPNKLVGAKYSETLRNILSTKNIKEIRDYSKVNVFKEASVYPVTFVIVNNGIHEPVLMTLMDSEVDIENKNVIPDNVFYLDIDWARYFVKNKAALNILIKLNKYKSLNNFFENVSGAATVNEAYEIKKLMQDSKDISERYKKFINTGTVDPYVSLWGYKKTNYIKQSYKNPIILDDDLQRFSLSRYNQSCSEKIIIGGMTKRLECFYDKGEYLAGKSTTIILPGLKDLKFILAILNSSLISFWYRIYFKSLSLAGGFLRIGNNEIKKIPIVDVDKNEQKPFIQLVNQILSITKDKDYLDNPDKQAKVKKLEKEIDKLVYKLYELTPEEIKIVEEFNEK